MKNLFKPIVVLLTALLCLLSFACSANTDVPSNDASPDISDENGEQAEAAPLIDQSHYSDSPSDSLIYDADIDIVPAAKEKQLSFPDIYVLDIDPDAVTIVFSDMLKDDKYDVDTYMVGDYENREYTYHPKDNDMRLRMANNLSGIYLMSKYDSDLSEIFLYGSDDPDYNEDFFSKEDLSFESSKNVAAKVKEMADGLGIELFGDIEVIPLKSSELNERQKALEEQNGKLPVTVKWEDTYFITSRIGYNGIPVLDKTFDYRSSIMSIPDSILYATITESGLKGLNIRGFTGEKGTEGNSTEIVSLEDAIASLNLTFSETISDDIVTIKKISIQYFLFDAKLCPVYVFEGEINNSSGAVIDTYLLVNAVTGNQII